jgi:hypothetical protein
MIDADFKYPDGASWQEMAGKVAACLKALSPTLALLVDDPKWHIHNYIARICLEYGIHPIWILVSLQRERSVLQGAEPTAQDFNLACGFVGSDAPGTLNPAWNGLANQIWRCARHSAWYGALAPKACFGYEIGIWPKQARRWDDWHEKTPEIEIDGKPHACATRAEYIQLSYTPHLGVLQRNDLILRAIAPYFI